MNLQLSAPCPLEARHRINDFNCGEPSLDDWLKRRAMNNQISGASRTFVVIDNELCVRGYYAMGAGAVSQSWATGAVRRNMPEPIPVLVLGRLAIDAPAQKIKLGAALLRDAIQRASEVAENIGVRALLVHALHDQAKQFYLRYGFQTSPMDPMTLMLRIR